MSSISPHVLSSQHIARHHITTLSIPIYLSPKRMADEMKLVLFELLQSRYVRLLSRHSRLCNYSSLQHPGTILCSTKAAIPRHSDARSKSKPTSISAFAWYAHSLVVNLCYAWPCWQKETGMCYMLMRFTKINAIRLPLVHWHLCIWTWSSRTEPCKTCEDWSVEA